MADYILNENSQQILKKNKRNSSILSTDNVVVVVVDVEKNSPAEKAGFVNGDVITGSGSSATYKLRTYSTDNLVDQYAQNDVIESEADQILDFSESNPFGNP